MAWIKKWDVPSSDGSKTYTVAVNDAGEYGCSCPVWKFRRKICKHITRIVTQEAINKITVTLGDYDKGIQGVFTGRAAQPAPNIKEVKKAAAKPLPVIPAQRVTRFFTFDD